MLMINAMDNENNRWKRNTKKKAKQNKQTKKGSKEQRGTEAIVKGWELNDFVVHLISQVFSN